jgi:outer membrane receptor protein involved in Fe transport
MVATRLGPSVWHPGRGFTLVAALILSVSTARAQERPGAVITGRVVLVADHVPIAGVVVSVEGTLLQSISDSAGRYRLSGVPPGPQVLLARRIGYAPARIPLTVPPTGSVVRDIAMAQHALELPEIQVTADVSGRARGEAGTSSVVERDAIAHQTATSLTGVLELLPGVPLQPPGLDAVQQFSLRSVATSTPAATTLGGPSAAQLASLGTLIILDGVPVSNNANLQTTGPRGEQRLAATGGAGIDLRQIPASTIERVEAIRGIPSARYGDLTQGVIVVDTRAGRVAPQLNARFDVRTIEASMVGGWGLGASHTVTAVADVAKSDISPGLSGETATRITAQLAHRATLGRRPGGVGEPRLALDTRASFFQLFQDNPEQPDVEPGLESSNRDRGWAAQERARLSLGRGAALTLTTAADYTQRRSRAQANRIRGASPFTDRLTEGTQEGRFVQGAYLSQFQLQGDEWRLYNRLEAETPASWLGAEHELRAGLELRREWNDGPGYLFDIEFPPQVSFNSVQGYDRPRRFDAIPPVATSGVYVDDRLVRRLLGQATLDLQAGLRLDLLHDGTLWTSGIRDAVLEPRVNAQLSPWPWLRLRAGWGRAGKAPTVGQLYPAPQYFDVVNVNWYATDPAERLAVLTTFIRDPTNPALGFSTADKREAGIELATPRGNAALSLVAFRDRTTGGIGYANDPTFLLREHFNLADSTTGTGVPPVIVEPAAYADTVPVLIARPANILTLNNHGFEATLSLPEFQPLGLQLSVQGAWIKTEFLQNAVDFGQSFSPFQTGTAARAPYWESVERTGEQIIVTYRLVHHEPRFGLVVSLTVQHLAKDVLEDLAGTDTLAFAGYITRTGELVPVPPERRADPEYAELHVPRSGVLLLPRETPADWLASLQVSKTLPLGGELRFYAFNASDRLGRFQESAAERQRQLPGMRFGVELTAPLPFGGGLR